MKKQGRPKGTGSNGLANHVTIMKAVADKGLVDFVSQMMYARGVVAELFIWRGEKVGVYWSNLLKAIWTFRFSSGNTPLVGMRFESEQAARLVASGQALRRTCRDHIIPWKVFSVEFFREKRGGRWKYNSVEQVESLLEYGDEACLITTEEDKRLTENGLKNKMPDGWKFGDDQFARYKVVGIKIRKDS